MASPTNPRRLKSLTIVIPVYNEGEVVREFHRQLNDVIGDLRQQTAVIYIDDGSEDKTPTVLEAIAARDPKVGIVSLSRNFGHQAALTAGLSLADADAIISMDGDGQNPPNLIPEMIKRAEAGYDIVQTKREGPSGQGGLKELTSRLFYWFINLISGTPIAPGVADFRLLTRPAANALRQMPEYHRFLRGMTAWLGFSSITLPYKIGPRLGGRSKYSFKRMLRLAIDAIFSFTLRPLYLMIGIGGCFILFAFAELVYVSSFWLRGLGHLLAPGWSSLMFVILFVGGTTMVSLGIAATYIGFIFQEIKGRPIYVIRDFRKPGKKKSKTGPNR
ncbi:MAG TPA: glycosyltransferase family 2 protein [Anaerolineales bacterium]|nr:glycosyltransferase family 2 protein [Anaerolineales bacterium]